MYNSQKVLSWEEFVHVTESIFTIKQTADQTGISKDTIRYYEKISLLPRADRKDNGHRIYRQKDIDTIHLITCMKKTGMSLEEMRPFLAVPTDMDPAEFPELVESLKRHRETIISQISSLQQVVNFIDMKLAEGRYRRDSSDQ
ncbi:DNA-binding transcriptional regulator, MerR family [Thermoactinomyces sp. DSM 45891]|uniref:MerR family transcriptional regulator n=1 Tax=Thermoactinomyces sp. DSM 45891 TaxID=1761907 RepID=UPI000914CF8E|nr:MerR family transcriptional regulator [Thermoactinomyces sp. DSM 45891]SFX03795.1 DNA-binding transcriptional regulator, MerR family [Thermoactinomyces sp. DSM 45891]